MAPSNRRVLPSVRVGIIVILFDNFNIVRDYRLDCHNVVFGDSLELPQLVLGHVKEVEDVDHARGLQNVDNPRADTGQLGDERDFFVFQFVSGVTRRFFGRLLRILLGSLSRLLRVGVVLRVGDRLAEEAKR